MAIDTLGANALASDSVTSAKIANDAVVAADIADGSITTAKIAAGAVTATKTSGIGGGDNNVIINGAMQIAQRATGVTGITTSGYYTMDRWKVSNSNLGTWTMSQSTDSPDGFAHSLRMDCTTADASPAANDDLSIQTRLEGTDLQHFKKGLSSAEQWTMSFYVKSSTTGTYICQLFDNNNNRFVSKSYTVSSANTWEQKTITFPADTTGALANTNGNCLIILWYLAAGSTFTSGTLQTAWGTNTNANKAVGQVNLAASTSNNWRITGVKLEPGDTASAFNHRSVDEELLRCSRYYQKTKAASDTYKHFGLVFIGADAGGTSYGTLAVPLVTTMRGIPALETTGTVSNYALWIKNTNTALSTFSVDSGIDDGTIHGQFYLNAFGSVSAGAGSCGAVRANNASAAYVALDAEL